MRPIAAEDFSTLVGAIYECALNPDLWPATLADLCHLLDFRLAALGLQEMPSGRLLLDVSTGLPAEDFERMRAYGPEAIEQWGGIENIMALPIEEPAVLTWANPKAHESRYSREWALPLGIIDNLAIAFTRDGDSLSSLSLGRHRDQGPVTLDDVARVRLFAPHLKRAVTIGRLLEARAVERATFAAVLDGLTVAVLLVGPDLRLVHANRAGEALLRTADPLGLRHGRVTAPSGLAAALQVTLAAPPGGLGRRGLGIPARRADGEEMVIHVLPLTDASPLAGAAAIFVAPAVTPPPAPLTAIAALFDLTPAEMRVLDLIGAGRTGGEIAAALGIAASTVRTHVNHLFEKTGTHRQADLVNLLASFTLPLA